MSQENRYYQPHNLTEGEYQSLLTKIKTAETARTSAEGQLRTQAQTAERERQALQSKLTQCSGEVSRLQTQYRADLSVIEEKHRNEIEKRRSLEASQMDLRRRIKAEHDFIVTALVEQRKEVDEKLRQSEAIITRQVDEKIKELEGRFKDKEQQQVNIATSLIQEVESELAAVNNFRVDLFQHDLLVGVNNHLGNARRYLTTAPQSAITNANAALQGVVKLRLQVEGDERLWYTYKDNINEQIILAQEQLQSLQALSFTSSEIAEEDVDDRIGVELINYWTHNGYSECQEKLRAIVNEVRGTSSAQRTIDEQVQLLNKVSEIRQACADLECRTHQAVVRDSFLRINEDEIINALAQDGLHLYDEVAIGGHAENGIAAFFRTGAGLTVRVDIPHDYKQPIISDICGLEHNLSPDIRSGIQSGVENAISSALGTTTGGQRVQGTCNEEYRNTDPSPDLFNTNLTRTYTREQLRRRSRQ